MPSAMACKHMVADAAPVSWTAQPLLLPSLVNVVLATVRIRTGAALAQAWLNSTSAPKILAWVSSPLCPTRKRQGCSLEEDAAHEAAVKIFVRSSEETGLSLYARG